MYGDRLREIRELRGLSQADLGQRTGLHQQQIYRIERGISNPGADTLTKLAKELEVSIDYLVGLVDEPADHFREDDLSAMERRLINAVREGRIIEVLETVATISKKNEQSIIVPDQKAVNS